jgi:micrococcal nuclease
MKYKEKEPYIVETNLKISKVIDGDSIIVKEIFGKKEKEIRLYGLDAPENKRNKKLRKDEKETHLAGEFLIKLGHLSTQFVLNVAPPGTNVTLITEKQNYYDFYKRQLAYMILPDGSCLNEILLAEGYAKPMNEYYCSRLSDFQVLNNAARLEKKGLYAISSYF